MKKIFQLIFLVSYLFFSIHIGTVFAAVGDIGHWRDSLGGQIPGTTFGGFNFNSEIRNDGIFTKPNASTVQVSEAGDYLIIATTHDSDASNGRYNSQLKVAQVAGTGNIFSSNYTGYSRDNSENESWTRAVGVIIGASANSQFQVQKRRDTDAPTGGSVINSSDFQVIRLDQTNYGIYGIGGTGNAYGGTTPNTVDITSIVSESNIAAIEGNITTDTVSLKGDNKKYLAAWSVSFNGASNTRTQRIGHLEYDGADNLATRSYCYMRTASNEYCGLGSMDLIETSIADISVQAEIYRGDGVGADQGGADNDGVLSTDGNGQMIVLEMPDTLEVFRSEDSVGLQDITAAQSLNIARDVNFNSPTSFTKISNTQVSVTNPADIFSWANIWTARQNVAAGQRLTTYGSIVIDGVEQTTGRHGSYSRGNQGAQDTFAMNFYPAGIFTTSGAGATLGVNTNPLAGTEGGGTDRTQPGTVGFFALNLDTLTPPVPNLGVTFTDNDPDNSVQTSQVVGYTLEIENTSANATGISAVAPIDTNFGTPYGFTYANCGIPTSSFSSPTLTFLNISVLGGNTCTINYYVQVDNLAPNGASIASSVDVSAAIEGGNNPASITGDTLTVIACGINDVSIVFETDSYGEDIFWSLVPNGNSCGVGQISSGGNPNLNCSSGGAPATAGAGDPYADTSIITEGPFSLTVGNTYNLHVIDDYGDGMTLGVGGTDPDIRIRQNEVDTDTYSVVGNGGVFTFTVQQPTACIDTLSPEVTINQAPSQSDPALTNSANYRVIFNEPINTGTFTSADITLTGTSGTITSGPTQVAPNNGTSFEFTVTGMTLFNTVTATIPAGGITDIAGNLNNASTSIDNQITYDPGDIIAPTITTTNFASGSLLPGGSHDIVIDYFDSDSGIDTGSRIFELYKWNGTSWGTNIAPGNIGTPTISTTQASYPTLDLDFGKYLFAFQISDNAGNSSSTGGVLYIDRPLFTVSTPEIDIGNIGSFSESYSPTVTLTVETVGAAFEVSMNRKTNPLYDTESIQSFDSISGYGYRPSPLSGSLQTIGVNQIIASQVQNINTNGNRNTYNYEIQLGALVDILQAAGDYEGTIDFEIEFEY